MDRPGVTRALEAVRKEIDAVDRDLVLALARRQQWVEIAARLKGDPREVRDQLRCEEVVSRVRETARQAGLSLTVAEPLWRHMMELWVEHQLRLLDQPMAG